jgi:hypothetical protein
MRAASGDHDVGEGVAALNGVGSRVDRRGFGPLDDVSLGTAERDAAMATITGGSEPITEGQDWGASSWISCSPKSTAHAKSGQWRMASRLVPVS